jgi:hypothetical protein
MAGILLVVLSREGLLCCSSQSLDTYASPHPCSVIIAKYSMAALNIGAGIEDDSCQGMHINITA